MIFDHNRFRGYFKPLDSLEPVPEVLPEDLAEFNYNIEREGMERVHNYRAKIGGLSIKAYVNESDPRLGQLRPDDLAGPYVDGDPPGQIKGVTVYRILDPIPHVESGI